jgi:glucose-6-phosphate 1-dehydrogenase
VNAPGAQPKAQDIVIFGAAGDLARCRLFPALYDLFREQHLPRVGNIIGYDLHPLSDAAFHDRAQAAAQQLARHPFDNASWPAFAGRLQFLSPADGGLDELARRCADRPRLLYLAIPPAAFAPTLGELAQHGLTTAASVVIEKPFGTDLANANVLNDALHALLDESQIFRIDHFLGKAAVRNILPLRFDGAIFELIWNRDAIDHVQITVAEDIGLEGRGAFYDANGALRDMVQNHILQLLALVAMEPPASSDTAAIRDEKLKLLNAVEPIEPADVVRGQYTSARVDGNSVDAYRDEPHVPTDSQTETFLAARLSINNDRWSGVPFFIRTGKRLPRRLTELSLGFRSTTTPPPCRAQLDDLAPDGFTIRIQPTDGTAWNYRIRDPGTVAQLRPYEMNTNYDSDVASQTTGDYERLIHAALLGDGALFVHSDEVQRSWEIVQPVLDAPPPLRPYAAGSWGPSEADDLIAPHQWLQH